MLQNQGTPFDAADGHGGSERKELPKGFGLLLNGFFHASLL